MSNPSNNPFDFLLTCRKARVSILPPSGILSRTMVRPLRCAKRAQFLCCQERGLRSRWNSGQYTCRRDACDRTCCTGSRASSAKVT